MREEARCILGPAQDGAVSGKLILNNTSLMSSSDTNKQKINQVYMHAGISTSVVLFSNFVTIYNFISAFLPTAWQWSVHQKSCVKPHTLHTYTGCTTGIKLLWSLAYLGGIKFFCFFRLFFLVKLATNKPNIILTTEELPVAERICQST